MVVTKFIHTILKRLERYLIRLNNFQLNGRSYDLILIVPSDKYRYDSKYSLILSAEHLNTLNQREVIHDLLNDFKNTLQPEEYSALSRINILNTNDPFVKNLKLVFGFREEIIEINEIPVGEISIDFAFLVKSLVLDKLIANRAVVAEIETENHISQTINMGPIKVEPNYDVVYYTPQGLRKISTPNKTDTNEMEVDQLSESKIKELIECGDIAKIQLEKILKIIH